MKQRLSPASPGRPWQHLQPVLDAEVDWGNSSRDGFVYVPQDGEWSALMRRPLHVEALEAAFEFPPGVRVGTLDNGDTYVVDAEHRVRIFAVNPSRPLGPPRKERTGLLRRLLGP